MTVIRRKLIEVALPLEAINRESAREKSIRQGHPSTLHLWWARRPLAACRAVLFAQLVDDPSANPKLFPTEASQAEERQRLFALMERLVVWENANDETLLRQAHEEILKSTNGAPPTILDPFAGGGSIPLEAQRLGLIANASDLNPVAVLINKALVEIPPKWSGHAPVFPGSAEQSATWPRATGLAEDARRYGHWMRDEAERRIGHLYPQAQLPNGTSANVVAWIWARTVRCPNPACLIEMPLVRSWWLSKKRGHAAFVIPRVIRDADGQRAVHFSIDEDVANAPAVDADGTVTRNGAVCVSCGTAAPLSYVRGEGKAGRMGVALMAVAAEGPRGRHYLPPSQDQIEAADVERPDNVPETELADNVWDIKVKNYGLTQHADLFTNRQLVALTTLSDLVEEARDKVRSDAISSGLPDDSVGLEQDGSGAGAYADSIAVLLALGVGRSADINNALCRWENTKTQVRNLFARQAISMVWDFAETPPLAAAAAGSFVTSVKNLSKAVERLPAGPPAVVTQSDAVSRPYGGFLICTDPPYYDNVGYANLSDFFYVWLRRSLVGVLPGVLGTLLTPKADELVADPYRHGGRDQAGAFFEDGFTRVFAAIRATTPQDYPITVFYAFKQTDSDDDGTVSTGWQTLLEGMLKTGWEVTSTWPIRTELANRIKAQETNSLASSIVLSLRPRPESADALTRRSFIAALKSELPGALKDLQQGSIAPVDLAQAAIGPGMRVFSRHSRVTEVDGTDMSVRTALAIINQTLDEVLVEQEGDFDAETRFCVKWFTQFGWNDAAAGEADVLSRAVNTSVSQLDRGGVFRAAAGRARLVEPGEMSDGWNPAEDKAISVWEVAVRVAYALQHQGADRATQWMAAASTRVDLDAVKELTYLMYSVCEKKGWTESAVLFNGLGTSWADLESASRVAPAPAAAQGEFDLDGEG